MGKGYEKNQERRDQLSSYGKDLARRAKSKCELTGKGGVPLVIYEVPPVPSQPDFERCLMVAADTVKELEKPHTLKAEEWRHLSEFIWSEERLVQVMSARLLNFLSPNAPWAAEILEDAYLDDDILEDANSAPLKQ